MKRSIFFAVVLVCLLTVLCLSVGAEVFKGKAVDEQWIIDNEGTNQEYNVDINAVAPNYRIWYELDTETGVLRIYHKDQGVKTEQKMLPYAHYQWVPWLKADGENNNVQRPFILEAVIEEGVLSVGRYTFYQCENLHTVYLPSSIKEINQTVFYECPNLEKIYYAGSREDFEENVFFETLRNDDALDKFVFGEAVTVIAKNQHGEVIEEYRVGGYFAGQEYSFLPKVYEGMTFTGDPEKVISGVLAENDQTVIELIYQCDHEYYSPNEEKPCISYCRYCAHQNPEILHVFNDEGTLPCKGICRICGDLYEFADGTHEYDSGIENAGDTVYCTVFCAQCGTVHHNEGGQHNIVQVNEKRSLLKDGQTGWYCSLCGVNEIEGQNALMFYIGIVFVALAAGFVIFLGIFLSVRRHKKIKDLTW